MLLSEQSSPNGSPRSRSPRTCRRRTRSHSQGREKGRDRSRSRDQSLSPYCFGPKLPKPRNRKKEHEEREHSLSEVRSIRRIQICSRSRSRSRERYHNHSSDPREGPGQYGEYYDQQRDGPQRQRQEAFLTRCLQEREKIRELGCAEVWGYSPRMKEPDSDEFTPVKEDEKNSSQSSSEGLFTKKGKNKTLKSNSDEEEIKKKRKKCKKSKKKKAKKSRRERSDPGSEVEWVEKTSVEEHIYGPEALLTHMSQKDTPLNFSPALLPGEGVAMAEYVKAGKRIPKRGEIELTSDKIAAFEHRHMEAVRLRKENQIYSAEEASFNQEGMKKREDEVMSHFRKMAHRNKGREDK